ncbi:MAG: AMP-binding protein [Candidatus Nanopelagicales bacterium]
MSRPGGCTGRRRGSRRWTGRRRRSRSGSSAATLNVAYNCVDRHVDAGFGDKVAIHFEGEPGDTRTLTYADLKDQVSRAANALTELGVQAGDRVAIYLPMIPEAAISMLACARIGAAHSVVFGGFSAEALRSRIEDAEAKVVITSDGGYRRGNAVGAQTRRGRGCRSLPERGARARRAPDWPGRRLDGQATSGGTTWWMPQVPSTHPRLSTPNSRCSSSTPRARPASQRASCTPPAAT